MVEAEKFSDHPRKKRKDFLVVCKNISFKADGYTTLQLSIYSEKHFCLRRSNIKFTQSVGYYLCVYLFT
jgi:hypothetical protein